MARFITLTFLIVAFLMPVDALSKDKKHDDHGQRQQWFKEMRAKKHEYLVQELQLTREQSEQFFAIYDKMDRDLKAVNDQTRRLEASIKDKDNVTDAEYDAVIDALYNQRYREWTIETQAKEEFSKILTKKQLVNLKKTEAKFMKALMKQHRQANAKK